MKTLLLITFAFSTGVLAQTESLEKACESADALSCSKLAYQYRKKGDAELAHKFYQKGCDLKDETACFNMKSINPRELYFKKVDALIGFHTQNIINCHIPKRGRPVYSETQLKEQWHPAHFTIHINQKGRVDAVNVSTPLSQEFKDCAKEVVRKIQFPAPNGIDPTYEYKLTILSRE